MRCGLRDGNTTEGSSAMAELKWLTDDEVDQVSGGIIVEHEGGYFVVGDKADWALLSRYDTYEDAKWFADRFPTSPEVLSDKEFEERFGFKFNPTDYI